MFWGRSPPVDCDAVAAIFCLTSGLKTWDTWADPMDRPRSATRMLVMSFEGELTPVFDVGILNPDLPPADGWGLGAYGGQEASVRLHKEAQPPQTPGRSQLLRNFEANSSSIFALHVREARWGAESLANTQPFMRAWSGREWMFSHCGSMNYPVEFTARATFEPIGTTDSELIFCELMSRISQRKWRNLGYVDFQLLRDWFAEFNVHGTMNSLLTDGRDVCIYSDAEEPLYVWEMKPPHDAVVFGDTEFEIDLTARGGKNCGGLIFSTRPLIERNGAKIEMRHVPPRTLTVVREGQIRYEIGPNPDDEHKTIVVRPRRNVHPSIAEEKLLEVKHTTVYQYVNPIEHSTHLLRLTPQHDRLQQLLYHNTTCSVNGRVRDYEDVFGNSVRRLLIQTPFDEMRIESHSILRVADVNPLRFKPLHARSNLPLVWMPWQHHMLAPYLLPPELPETQLLELADYAMSFARRNDHDLLEALIDINQTLFREYKYLQGSTTVLTTAYEVFEHRQGVCQDFTNLFICLARLLGVPARYVCGYIYTGPKNSNHLQSEASHAWTQVYLPEVGWKGFDPTNGILTQTDHVRVAVGRNYVDATPTSGTIYVGGGGERLTVDVTVEPVGRVRLDELTETPPQPQVHSIRQQQPLEPILPDKSQVGHS